MRKKILTLEDLVKFCKDQNLCSFSSQESGYQLCVQIPATFSADEVSESTLFGNIILLHTGRNRNGSNVTVDAAKKCLATIPYKPILADIQEIDGELDFTSHAMEITEDGSMRYIERQVGCFTADKAYLDDEENADGRRYIHARVAIPRDYTAAAEIIERKQGTKVSAELAVNSMEYDAKASELMLTDVEVMGCTLLGKDPDSGEDVQEGMQGARLDIQDFSIENNAVRFEHDEKMVEMLEQLNRKLDELTINTNSLRKEEKGRMNEEKFNELLAKYNKTAEDITFEYENLDDVELEKAFAEAFDGTEDPSFEENAEPEVEGGDTEEFADEGKKEANVEETTGAADPVVDTDSEPEGDSDEGSDDTDGDDADFTLNYSVNINGTKKEFAVSLADKMNALYALVNDTYGEADNAWYDVDVYEEPTKFVVMHDFWGNRHFKQEYTVKKDVYALKGDRIPVFSQFLTQDEINQLEGMKSNYAALEIKVEQYEAEPDKVALLESPDYDQIKDTKEYEELAKRDNYFALTKDELTEKLDGILLDFAKKNKVQFAAKEVKPEKKHDFFAFARIENNTSFLDGLLKK